MTTKNHFLTALESVQKDVGEKMLNSMSEVQSLTLFISAAATGICNHLAELTEAVKQL